MTSQRNHAKNGQRIGFVGLGLMGFEMVKNLLSAGYAVVGYDLDRQKIAAAVRLGAAGIDRPDHLAAEVDVIMLSLPNSQVVDQVVTNELKLFDTGRKGQALIDMTTADPSMSEMLADRLKPYGIDMLDATISGGPGTFARKEATLMAGGEAAVFERCRPILAALSEHVLHVGQNGAGALVKLMVNLISGVSRMALAEGLALCRRAGVDQHMLLEVLRRSPHYSRSMETKAVRMIAQNFSPAAGKLAFHLKDVRLMLELGKRLNFPLPLTSLHAQALTAEVAKGRGDRDNTAIISFYEDLANL